MLHPKQWNGRKPGQRNKRLELRDGASGCVYDPRRWCAEADISRSKLYQLWQEGRGPRYVRFGNARRVLESPREYLERIALEEGAVAGGDPEALADALEQETCDVEGAIAADRLPVASRLGAEVTPVSSETLGSRKRRKVA